MASKSIKKSQAIYVMIVLFILGFSLMSFLSLDSTIILLVYVLLNIMYSFVLKNIPIIDILSVSTGFVLRVFIGAVVINVEASNWIIIMTFLLSLFISLAKRRDDVYMFSTTGIKMRNVIGGYSLQFLDTSISIVASVIIISYINYSLSPNVTARINSDYLYLTTFFVIAGVMRYLYITLILKDSGSPTQIVWSDRFIQLVLASWVISLILILYR